MIMTQDQIIVYLEGLLSPEERRRFESALESDEEAARQVGGQRQFDQTLRALLGSAARDDQIRRSVLAAISGRPVSEIKAQVLEKTKAGLNQTALESQEHFLESFLQGIGNLLHLPWWGVNALFFVLTGIAFVTLLDTRIYFPNTGSIRGLLGLFAECVLGTGMYMAVANLRATTRELKKKHLAPNAQAIWLKRYFAGFNNRWFPFVGFATFYLLVAAKPLVFGDEIGWKWLELSLVSLWPTFVKIVALQWAFAFLIWFEGLIAIARGQFSPPLSPEDLAALSRVLKLQIIQFNLATCIPAGLWVYVTASFDNQDLTWTKIFWCALPALLLLETVLLFRLEKSRTRKAIPLSDVAILLWQLLVGPRECNRFVRFAMLPLTAAWLLLLPLCFHPS